MASNAAMSCDKLQLCCAASTRPLCCGYCCASTGKSRALNVNKIRPCAVAPSSCAVSEASRGIHAVGVRVTSWPRAINAMCSAFMDVSASRCSRGGAMCCRLARRVGRQRRVDLALMGGREGQGLLDLGHGQIILHGELCRRQTPGLSRHDERLHTNARPAHDCRGLTTRPTAVGDMRKGWIVEALAQGAHLLGHSPEDKLVEGDPLLRRPGFGVLFELHRKIQGIPSHRGCPYVPRFRYILA